MSIWRFFHGVEFVLSLAFTIRFHIYFKTNKYRQFTSTFANVYLAATSLVESLSGRHFHNFANFSSIEKVFAHEIIVRQFIKVNTSFLLENHKFA